MSTELLADGPYEIYTKTDSTLIVTSYTDNGGEGTRVRVNKSDGYEQNVIVQHVDGDRYTLTWSLRKLFIGFDKDNLQTKNYPFSTSIKTEWSINKANDGSYKIKAPYDDAVWSVPDNAGNATQVSLTGAQGRAGEFWIFKSK